jgi:drug/metabolite transporter (DMT)-like permease
MGMELTGTPVSQRWISGIVISSIGVITGLTHIDHLLENLHTMPVVSGIVFPLCLSVVLLYAGYWLGTSDYSGEQAVSIAVWSITGAVVLTLSGTLILATDISLHDHVVPATDGNAPTIILPSSVTEGTVIGFTYGIYETWRNRRMAGTD